MTAPLTHKQIQENLVIAIIRRDWQMIDKCLARGGDIYALRADGKNTVFTFAIGLGHIDLLTGLLDRGAQLHYQTIPGESVPALAVAVMRDLAFLSTARVKILQDRGADPDISFRYNNLSQQTVGDMLRDILPHAIPPEDDLIAEMQGLLQVARDQRDYKKKLHQQQMEKLQAAAKKRYKL